MLKPEAIAELNKIAKEIKSIDHCYGSGLLTPFAGKVNSSRSAMFYAQLTQAKNLTNPQTARVSTGYEKVFGDRSTSYRKAESDYIVLNRIRKFDNDYVYLLVIQDIKTGKYDVIYRTSTESFAESSGVYIDNDYIDSLNIGDSIDEGEILHSSRSYDENMNYRLGLNAKAVYMVDPAIVEDAYKISTDLQERMKSTSVYSRKIPKNNNDVLLNIYGDKETYKAFPDIGEKIKDKVVCVRRRVDHNNSNFLLKNKNLRKEMFGDTPYFADGIITDIDIYSNIPMDQLPQTKSHEQINKYLGLIHRYWEETYEVLGKLVEDPSKECSEELTRFYSRAKDALSITDKIRWEDEGSIFDNMIIYITIVKESPLFTGSKIVGRQGNKGVISEIVDKKHMPTNSDGEHADIIFSAVSVMARLNPSQLNEIELNWVVDNILEGDASKEEKFDSLMDLLSICNPNQETIMRSFYKSLPKNEKKDFLKSITKEFVIFQPPSMSIDFKQYEEIIDRFKPKKKKFTIISDDGKELNIQRKMIMSDTYILRLKHEPITKFSIRSKGTINPRTFLPIKSNAYRKGTALFNNQAIRLGNMELDILQLCNDPAALNYMSRLYCTSVTGRREFSKLLDIDIFNEDITLDMENSKSKVIDMFNATFFCTGMELVIEVDKDYIEEPIEMNVNEEIEQMSKKEIRLVFKDSYKK